MSKSKNIKWLLISLGLCTGQAIISCKQSPQPEYPTPTAIDPKTPSTSTKPETVTTPGESASLPAARLYFMPSEARASIDPNIKLETNTLFEKLEFPSIAIDYKLADFVRILRCPKSYQLKTLTGEDASQLQGRPGQQGALAWVWARALEDRKQCKVVGTNIATQKFSDLAAPKGHYYYIVNPCVSKERSIFGVEDCSYDLQISRTIKIETSFSDIAQEAASDLTRAESALNASLLEAIQLAQKIEIHLRACEDMVAFDNEALNFKKGLIQLGIMGVGLTIGGVLGGPTVAVMAGQMGTAMGSQLLYSKVLKWPAAFANECIDPKIQATNAEQRKNAAKAASSDGTHQLKYKGRYEEEFRVQTLTRELQALIDPEKGTVKKNTETLKEAMTAMQKLGLNILTLDQAQSKAANEGIDLNDPSTFARPN